jgi:NAD(P)-dependent dehydrogenase (short-subunit alcohol dehydrogenase family)
VVHVSVRRELEALADKVAVVTGSARGIGRGIAEALAEQKVRLVLCDIDEANLESTVSSLRASGAEVIGVPADVTDPHAVNRVRDSAYERFETVHVLCNNPGPRSSAPLLDLPIDVDEWRSGLELLLYSIVHGLNAFLPGMLEQNEGHIVNTSSRAAYIPSVTLGVYSPAKAAVVALSEVLQAELAALDANIGVSVITPGLVRTPVVLDRLTNRDKSKEDPWTQAFLDRVETGAVASVDPIDVGRLVVRAIQTRALYVETFGAAVEGLQQRFIRANADAKKIGLRA